MTINNRVKEVREQSGLSMRPFGEKIGMSATNVSRMEKGERVVTDRTIKLICNEFNVNENWLRTDKGEMYTQIDEDEKIMKMMAELAKSEDKDAQDLFIALYSLKGEYFEIAKDIIFSLEKRNSKK